MPRARKRHVQQQLFRHGGKRKGAGRPAKGPRPSERHKTRPHLASYHPVHITLRVVLGLGTLRRRDLYRAIRWASLSVADKQQDRFRIVHLSIQSNHVHLIAEACDRIALARGVQGFEGSAAKHVNRTLSRRGRVFADRYHARILKSPRSVRHAVSYVLNNWRHHAADRGRSWLVDPFSSGISFAGWAELAGATILWKPTTPTYEPLWVWLPRTWLLQQAGTGAISARDVPG
jgi:putative transposase